MTIGEKIKLARNLRGFTQKELGFLVKLQDVRIRQYETDARTPKPSQLQAIAKALGVPMEFFYQNSLEKSIEIMHILFDIDYISGVTVEQIGDDRGNLTKYAVVFDDVELNGHLGKWYKKLKEVNQQLDKANDEVSQEVIKKDYSLWKVRYPESMLEEMETKIRLVEKDLLVKRSEDE